MCIVVVVVLSFVAVIYLVVLLVLFPISAAIVFSSYTKICPGATCAMEAAFRWQLLLERVRYAAGMPMADVWNVDGVITCVQSLDALGMSMSSTVGNTPWPCKFCWKEPLDTVWYIGDDDATCPFDTASRICHECYLGVATAECMYVEA